MRRVAVLGILVFTFCFSQSAFGQGANWNTIEPYVTSLDQVRARMGPAAKETDLGPVYNFPWGTVEIVMVSSQDVSANKFRDKYQGKVKGIVVELRGSTLTPLALGLVNNPEFEKQSDGKKVRYADDATGLTYQFLDDKLAKIFYEGASGLRHKATK